MKIAVTYENGNVFQHFGRTRQFKLYEVENGAIQSERILEGDEAGHSALAAQLEQAGVDTLVLGCTHYPLLESVIGNYMGPGVTLVSAGAEGARAVAETLRERSALAGGRGRGACRYFVSDRVEDFSRLASIFLGWDVADSVGQVEIGRY